MTTIYRSDSRLTFERLRELLNYDAETGVFRWQVVRRGGGIRCGDVAGSTTDAGYRNITIDHTHHKAHRLAWLYTYGRWPVAMIDHRNEDKGDNRLSNLREATRVQNLQNISTARVDSSTGIRGIYPGKTPGTWVAQIRVNGRASNLGTFPSQESASLAYRAAKAERHPFWNQTHPIDEKEAV